MEFMRSEKSEVVVFGKGFVPVFGFFFTGTESEFTHIRNLEKAGGKIQITIDEEGHVTIDRKEIAAK